MRNDNKVSKWIIVIIALVIVVMITGKVSDVLEINRRPASYLVISIFFFGWYFVDIIRNRRK